MKYNIFLLFISFHANLNSAAAASAKEDKNFTFKFTYCFKENGINKYWSATLNISYENTIDDLLTVLANKFKLNKNDLKFGCSKTNIFNDTNLTFGEIKLPEACQFFVYNDN